jgi:uncharacterized protein (TIGR03083 family)
MGIESFLSAGADDPAMFAAEREAFLGLAVGLTSEQWDARSLCPDWTVRDVVVHIAFHTHRVTLGDSLGGTEKVTARMLAHEHVESNEDLLRWLASPVPPKMASRMNISEVVIHEQDIRRALDLPRRPPDDTLRVCLDLCSTWRGAKFTLGHERRTSRGLCLVADDMSWSYGSGPEITGDALLLLLAIAGRHSVLSEIKGPGVPMLTERLGPAPATAAPG